MDHETDFAVLVVVPEAWAAAEALFGKPDHLVRRAGQNWALWDVKVKDGGQVRVVIDETLDRGDIAAQEAAALILAAWRPRFLLLADIGGGFKGRDGLQLGDLVVASNLEYYSLVKEIEGRTEPRDLPTVSPARSPRKDLPHLNLHFPDWFCQIPVERPQIAGSGQPKILSGQIVVGERLLADPDSPTVAELAASYPKALAVDMESIGVARAVYAAQQQEISTQYAILRGISDFVDDKTIDNQGTRDSAKPYAAAVAVTAAAYYIKSHPSDESVLRQPHPAEHADHLYLEQYLRSLRRALAARPDTAQPRFRLPLRSTEVRIEGSAAPQPGLPVERGEILDVVEQDRLVAVVGKSGAGKSELLNAAARQLAPAADPVVIRVDLKTGWSPTWAEAMPDTPYGAELDSSIDALLNAASPRLSVDQLNGFIKGDGQAIVLVDALNEVPPEVASKIRLALGQYIRRHPNVQVLATDRGAGPDYELQWTVLDLPMLEPDEARRVIDETFGDGTYEQQPDARQDILRIPFFLDRALTQGAVDFTSRADLVARFLQDGGLEEADFDLIGEIALGVLRRGETVLAESEQVRLEEQGAWEKLLEGGFIIIGPAGPVFSHQLIHQYFAGRSLAAQPDLWRPEVMDAVTFFAASLDGVGMVVKAIPDPQGRDRLLQIVYDWNWRAAVLALSEARAGENSASEATEQAILAMAAEKQFDPVEGTRKRISDLLETVESPTAERFRVLEEDDLGEAIRAIAHPEIEWWDEWKQVFLARDPVVIFSDKMIDRIASDMPLIGWMTANTLRRINALPEVAEIVRFLYKSHPDQSAEHEAIRWRIVHTLGAWPAAANADLLVAALTDEHVWCRYGAVRSLVEMAARTKDQQLRAYILEQLGQKWRDLDPEPLSQLAWASRYGDADASWPQAIRPLIEEVRSSQQGEERERWNRRLADFDRYAEKHALTHA